MSKFEFNFAVEANSQTEANEKMKALSNLVRKLKTTELQKVSGNALALNMLAAKLDPKTLVAFANVVANQPSKVAMAKKFLGIK